MMDEDAVKAARRGLRRAINEAAPLLSLDELSEATEQLTKLVQDRMRHEARTRIATLHIGSSVKFEHRGIRRVGKVVKLQGTSVSVRVEGSPGDTNAAEVWRVDAVLVSPIEDSNRRKDLPKKRKTI